RDIGFANAYLTLLTSTEVEVWFVELVVEVVEVDGAVELGGSCGSPVQAFTTCPARWLFLAWLS
ncbi:MAG TPA: hypothetical protein V6D16_08075, partial [Candidatus Obscuribacterales bacterium]